MSIETTLARVGAIRQAISDPAALVGSQGALTGATEAPSTGATPTSFAAALSAASTSAPAAALTTALAGASAPMAGGSLTAAALGGSSLAYPGQLQALQGVAGSPSFQAGGSGSRIVAVAEGQLGQGEQPPGSNESPAIAAYRTATAGAVGGEPWCAYFASWSAREAGEPLGPQGQGLGSVSEIWSWAQSAGRALVNGPGVVPKPGDLIVFGGEHVGIVRDVLPDGRIQTIEGNYENKVAANVRSASEASGYVSMS